MEKRILRSGSWFVQGSEAGFTLPEVMIATAISIVVILANLAVFNVANKNFAYTRAMTNATNHATDKINEFKTKLITSQPCKNTVTGLIDNSLVNTAFPGSGTPCLAGGSVNVEYPGLEDQPLYLPSGAVNPSYSYGTGPASIVGVTQSDSTAIGGVTFTRTWVISFADPNNDGVFTMKSDVVKVKVVVSWTQYGKNHHVTMTTFTTGKGIT